MGNSTYWEIKVSLIAFRQVLTKIVPAPFIQLHNYDLFEKYWLKLTPLIQNSVQQNHIQESYASISFLTKNVKKLLHPPGVDYSPFLWTFMGKPGDGGKSYPTAKILLICPTRKISINRFKSFAIKSFISSSSNNNFQVITLSNLHF